MHTKSITFLYCSITQTTRQIVTFSIFCSIPLRRSTCIPSSYSTDSIHISSISHVRMTLFGFLLLTIMWNDFATKKTVGWRIYEKFQCDDCITSNNIVINDVYNDKRSITIVVSLSGFNCNQIFCDINHVEVWPHFLCYQTTVCLLSTICFSFFKKQNVFQYKVLVCRHSGNWILPIARGQVIHADMIYYRNCSREIWPLYHFYIIPFPSGFFPQNQGYNFKSEHSCFILVAVLCSQLHLKLWLCLRSQICQFYAFKLNECH